MSETKVIDIKELKFDEHNFNRHNDEGMSLLEKSIKENGLGRSILLDKDNNIVGGNGVTEKAIELGKTKVRIIETDGTELIAVKRTDLTLAREVWQKCKSDGKYIESREDEKTIICQSNLTPVNRRAAKELAQTMEVIINPLGDWTGGTGVDSGATNRKLGSDMGDGVTGGGLHGKDLSKADVSVNIYCHQLAQAAGKPVTAFCAIGDEQVIVRMDGEEARLVPYGYIVEQARKYIHTLGGFERFAEWGLIR